MRAPRGVSMSVDDTQDAAARFPALAPGCDPTGLSLNPQEGFLLSRIDGQTPLSVLREIAGMPAEEVDLCLESWEVQGLIRFEVRRPVFRPKAPRAAGRRAAAVPKSLDESQIDPSLDLDPDTQRRILEFELRLERPYHEILDVSRDADAKQIKRAYFKLSKEYHPDRYFRKQIGGYAQRLDRVFKKVLEAYELLSDPTTRAEIERSLRDEAPGPEPPPASASAGADGGPAEPRKLTKRELLRARMPFKIPESVKNERRQKAEQFFQSSQMQLERGQWLEAASNIRLAIAFDPANPKYKAAFGDVQAQASEMRARQMLAQADSSADSSQQKEALRLYEEALLYRPYDPEVNHKAARVALAVGEAEKAQEYVDRALEQRPEVGAYHRTRAEVLKRLGHHGHAIKELEKALEIDAADHEARELLRNMRQRGRTSPGGKR